jgi:hypothetical protein
MSKPPKKLPHPWNFRERKKMILAIARKAKRLAAKAVKLTSQEQP